MSDDLRERTPLADQGDNPAEDGTRSDRGASDGGAPGRQSPVFRERAANNTEPLTGQGTGAGGGYGVGSGDASSGGSQERSDDRRPGNGPETDWLRDAESAADDGIVLSSDVTHDEGIATRGDDGMGAQGAETE